MFLAVRSGGSMGTNHEPEPGAVLIYRAADLARLLGCSVASVYRWTAAGQLPARRQLGPSATGWLAAEIRDWLTSRPTVGAA